MRVIERGEGLLIGWHDPDENRAWILNNKTREMKDKRMSVEEAVSKFVRDGDFLAMGGFGHVRTPMAIIYEIIRRRKRDLTLAAKPGVHDSDLLIGSGCVGKVEVAYCFGHELRGLSPASRRAVETGRCRVVAENSNAGLQWRFLAAMMGVPFIPARVMLGSETLRRSSAMVAECPFSGKPITLLPACHPDVALIHVPRCDVYGNAQIDGILSEDMELSRAARRLIISTEEIVDEERIRMEPCRTVIPYFVVDAVVKVPYGSHPCQMPLLYYFDEEHIGEWLECSKTMEGTEEYLSKYVYEVEGFEGYLELVGGKEKLRRLMEIEALRRSASFPWARRRRR